ncbi:MAG: hypothetical protein IV101_13610 [Dechloromonas sp.]|uniref:hypothetical protein n=1 Tax=Dechloromonas sp. TaxID=1917218 RepID=UPI0027E8B0DD|nr:hypothetical protein [Dechloromonas sp.]MBT9521916.1 hypothetical protein [Dechloromonas sp.]
MATTDSTAAPNLDIHEGNCPRDLGDEITQRLAKAEAIVDLLGQGDSGGLNEHSLINAAWAAKDLLREAGQFIDVLEKMARHSKEVTA